MYSLALWKTVEDRVAKVVEYWEKVDLACPRARKSGQRKSDPGGYFLFHVLFRLSKIDAASVSLNKFTLWYREGALPDVVQVPAVIWFV